MVDKDQTVEKDAKFLAKVLVKVRAFIAKVSHTFLPMFLTDWLLSDSTFYRSKKIFQIMCSA